MPAGNWTLYQSAKLALVQADIDTNADTFVCVLLAAAHTPAANTHSTYANVSGNEVTGTGYTAGGVVLTGVTSTASAGTVTFTANAMSWANSTITAKWAVIIKRAGGSIVAGDRLLCYVDLDNTSGATTVSSTAGTFTITPNASGIFTLT